MEHLDTGVPAAEKPEQFDMHAATDAPPLSDDDARRRRDDLRAAFDALGFKDDNLVERGLRFDPRTQEHYATCPLIDIHVSRKIRDARTLKELTTEVRAAMEKARLPGYYHSEFIAADVPVPRTRELRLKPFFAEPLRLSPDREKDKVWDIHVAMLTDEVHADLERLLVDEAGLYRLRRRKPSKTQPDVTEDWTVYTVQGVNDRAEGKQFFDRLVRWLDEIGAPSSWAKLEITTDMRKYHGARAVPPTVDSVVYRD